MKTPKKSILKKENMKYPVPPPKPKNSFSFGRSMMMGTRDDYTREGLFGPSRGNDRMKPPSKRKISFRDEKDGKEIS